MQSDRYLRAVLTVIAAALVYLCIVLTPMPVASAQQPRVVGGRTPGEYTGPAEVTIVDWRLPEGASLPVNITRGDVRVVNDVSVSGKVEVTQPPHNPLRTVTVGHEENASSSIAGHFVPISSSAGRGMPVSVVPPRP